MPRLSYDGDEAVYRITHRGGETTYVVAERARDALRAIEDWSDDDDDELPVTIEAVAPDTIVKTYSDEADLLDVPEHGAVIRSSDDDPHGLAHVHATAADWAAHYGQRGHVPCSICSTAWQG